MAADSPSTKKDEDDTRFRTWLSRLITKEDPYHLHKSLGFACLLSYLWRFYVAITSDAGADMGFALYPQYTLPTLALHLSLNLSAFVFTIPPKRITTGYRIWPEYRVHSLVFLGRSLTFLWLQYTYDQRHDDNAAPNHYARNNLLVIILSMAAADIGSACFAESSGFARQLDVHPAVRFGFSFLQILATSGCLCIHGRYAMHYVFCCIIQVNAFLMTLRRKNLASHHTLVAVYAAMLLSGWILGESESARLGVNARYQLYIVGLTAALLRLSPRDVLPAYLRWVHNKYFIWPFCYGLTVVLRPWVERKTECSELFYAAVVCHVPVIVMAVYKVNNESRVARGKPTEKSS